MSMFANMIYNVLIRLRLAALNQVTGGACPIASAVAHARRNNNVVAEL